MTRYEFDGEKYRQASRHQKDWGNQLIGDLTLNGDESILDLGCGDGALTAQLAAAVPNGRVLGIDASIGMLEAAKRHEEPNLEFRCLDINRMDFNNEFDVIFSNAALHWVKDHAALLANSYAALRPDGILRWNFAGAGNCPNFIEVAKRLISSGPYRAYFEDFTWPWFMPSIDEYRDLVANTAFTNTKIELVNADRFFSDADELTRWIDQPTIVPFLQPLPSEKKQEFRDEVVAQMVPRTTLADGRCLEPFRRLSFRATKPIPARD